MPTNVCQHLLRDAIDLKLGVDRKVDPLINMFVRREFVVLDRLRKQKFQCRDQADVFEDRWAQVFADPSESLSRPTRSRCEAPAGPTRPCPISSSGSAGRQASGREVAGDAAAFTLSLVRKVKSRRCQLAVSLPDPSMLKRGQHQTDQCDRQQNPNAVAVNGNGAFAIENFISSGSDEFRSRRTQPTRSCTRQVVVQSDYIADCSRTFDRQLRLLRSLIKTNIETPLETSGCSDPRPRPRSNFADNPER